MKNWSLPRLALVLWFVSYAFWAILSYLFKVPFDIAGMIVKTTVIMSIMLLFIGFWQEA